MSFFNLLKNLFKTKTADEMVNFPGVLIDDRSQSEQEEDIQFGEIVRSPEAVFWQETSLEKFRSFGVQNQASQSSCVANAGRKALRINMIVNHKIDIDFSSLDIYRRRVNYPKAGMASNDLFNILQDGATLNAIVPSDGFNEAYANAVRVPAWARKLGETFKISSGVTLPIDFETCASVIQRTGKGVVLFFYFTADEWSRMYPLKKMPLNLTDQTALRHAVVAVDYGMINGKKWLKIEDSAHFAGLSVRFISEEFFAGRCFYAGYCMNFKFDSEPQIYKPKYTFNSNLAYGDENSEVLQLQKCLQYLQLFPSNVEPTGKYYGLTAKAVLEFQKKYNVASIPSLEKLAGKSFGPDSRKKLNELLAS